MNIKQLTTFFLFSTSPLLAGSGSPLNFYESVHDEISTAELGTALAHNRLLNSISVPRQAPVEHSRYQKEPETQTADQARGTPEELQEFLTKKLKAGLSEKQRPLAKIDSLEDMKSTFIFLHSFLSKAKSQEKSSLDTKSDLFLRFYAAQAGALWVMFATTDPGIISESFKHDMRLYHNLSKEGEREKFFEQLDQLREEVKLLQKESYEEVSQLTLRYLKEVKELTSEMLSRIYALNKGYGDPSRLSTFRVDGISECDLTIMRNHATFFMSRTRLHIIAHSAKKASEKETATSRAFAFDEIEAFNKECKEAPKGVKAIVAAHKHILTLEGYNTEAPDSSPSDKVLESVNFLDRLISGENADFLNNHYWLYTGSPYACADRALSRFYMNKFFGLSETERSSQAEAVLVRETDRINRHSNILAQESANYARNMLALMNIVVRQDPIYAFFNSSIHDATFAIASAIRQHEYRIKEASTNPIADEAFFPIEELKKGLTEFSELCERIRAEYKIDKGE